MTIAVARRSAFASRLFGFLFRPSVRRTLLMSCPTSLAGNLTLLVTVHHSEAASRLGHDASITR